jgi:hypothetical protein
MDTCCTFPVDGMTKKAEARTTPPELSLQTRHPQGGRMNSSRTTIALAAGLTAWLSAHPGAQRTTPLPITVRPATLADAIEQLAGARVRVPNARVVGVFNPRVFVVDSDMRLRSPGYRDRVLVFVESGGLTVSSSTIVGATVRIAGVARTLLSMQVTREVPWPPELNPGTVKRLEIRAAVLADSVHTAEGVELTRQTNP